MGNINDCCTLALLRHDSDKSAKNTEIFSKKNSINETLSKNREFISNYGSHFSSTVERTTGTYSSSTSDSTNNSHSSSAASNSSVNNSSAPSDTLNTKYIQLQRAATFHNDDQFNIDDKCQKIGGCKAIKRIIKALKWHSLSFYDKKRAIVSEKIMESQYDKFIMDDYQHILSDHLFEFKLIRDEINKQIEPCNINSCVGFERFLTLSTKDLSKCDDRTFCIDFMDLIHCYLIHSQNLH